MHEDLSFVDRLHRDLREVRWAEPEEIRGRARRRSRRTAALAATAVLAVLSGSAYAVAGWSGPPVPSVAGTPVWTATPARAEVPQEALLSPQDVPLKTGVRLARPAWARRYGSTRCWSRAAVSGACRRRRSRPLFWSQTLLRPATDRSRRRVRCSARTSTASTRVVGQQPFGAVTLLLDACAEWQVTGSVLLAGRTVPTVSRHRWELPVSGFAGDESMMLRHVTLAPQSRADGKTVAVAPPIEVTMLVRVGDLVTVIGTGPGTVKDDVDGTRPGPGLSYPDLEALGRTAARRLCVAADPPC